VLGVIGDLFESLVKRVGKCKDSGTFFTGQVTRLLLLY
jgi:CDP-diglyceride synthetase